MNVKNVLTFQFVFVILVIAVLAHGATAEVIYVDSASGNDINPGTKEKPLRTIARTAAIVNDGSEPGPTIIKIEPGAYCVTEMVVFENSRQYTNEKRFVIEATVLPDEPNWTPASMPVVLSTVKGEGPDTEKHAIALKIEVNHATVRGIKFLGNPRPRTWGYSIFRSGKGLEDLIVTQCLFVGDEDASHLQVGIIAHGNKIRADHCIFYNARNSVVFWQNAGGGVKTGNGITNSIIYGTTQSAVWTAWPDKDFIFENNIIANCNYVWMKNSFNSTRYTMNNCIVVNNNNYQGDESRQPTQFALDENIVIKNVNVLLSKKESNVHLPLPKDYLHIIPGALGYDIGAGIFKSVKNRK
jgi:hypothetical protein